MIRLSQEYHLTIDHHMVPMTLKAGENSILVKTCDEMGFWGSYLRLTDPDDKPFTDLAFSEK